MSHKPIRSERATFPSVGHASVPATGGPAGLTNSTRTAGGSDSITTVAPDSPSALRGTAAGVSRSAPARVAVTRRLTRALSNTCSVTVSGTLMENATSGNAPAPNAAAISIDAPSAAVTVTCRFGCCVGSSAGWNVDGENACPFAVARITTTSSDSGVESWNSIVSIRTVTRGISPRG